MYRVDVDDELILETTWPDDALAEYDRQARQHGARQVNAYVLTPAFIRHPNNDCEDVSDWDWLSRRELADHAATI